MTDLLPARGAIRLWVELHRELGEAPDEAHLATAVATISAGIGWRAPISWGGGSEEPCTVSVILEGQSATAKKTTTANIARRLVGAATARMDDEKKPLHVHLVSHTSGRGILEMVGAKSEEEATDWEDTAPPGHLIVWDEFGSMLGDPGQQRKGGDWQGQIRTTLLQVTNGWHGGSKTGSLKLPASRVAVAVLGTMTRVELEQRVDSGLLQDGFLGRFMIIPHNGAARYIAIPRDMNSGQVAGREQLENWLRALAERKFSFGNPFGLMTADARDRREAWYYEQRFKLEDALREDPTDDVLTAMLAAFGRLQATQVKLAMIQAIAELSIPELAMSSPTITEEHLEWAERLVELSLVEMGELARAGTTLPDRYRERVIAYLKRAGEPVIRGTLMQFCAMAGFTKSQRWAIVLDMEQERTVVIDREKTGRPGHPKEFVRLPKEDE